jgi:tetratricopeptide (TPR) repeat protein
MQINRHGAKSANPNISISSWRSWRPGGSSSASRPAAGLVGSLSMALGVFALQACGGSAPPPQAPPSPAASAEELPASPEPPASADLLAGIKAFDAGRYADARASFEAASKKNPKNYEALANLGMACEKLGDGAAAEAAYKAALAVKPDLESASVELSALYIDAGRIDEALEVGRAGVAAHPGSAALHENVGVALATRGDSEGATPELEQAVRLAPSEPMFQLTIAHWLNVWHTRGAAPHLDAAVGLIKGDYGMTASVGYEYRMAGEFASCVKTFDAEIAARDGGEVRTERALCHLGLKDEPAAIDDLQAAVKTEPGYAPAHYYLAGRLASGKHFKEAAEQYAQYLKLAPSGSLAKPAAERLKAAQEAARKAAHGK